MHRKWVSTKIDGPWDGELLTKIDGLGDGATLKSMDSNIVFRKNRWTLGWGTPQIDGP